MLKAIVTALMLGVLSSYSVDIKDFPVFVSRQVFTKKMAVLDAYIWTVAISTAIKRRLRRTAKNGGKWKSFIKRPNPMQLWLNHRPNGQVQKTIMGISKNSINSFSLREKVGMMELKSSSYISPPNPLGNCSCVAKPQGRGECGKYRSIFPPTTYIHVGIPEGEGIFRGPLI